MFAAVDFSPLGQEEGINVCKYLHYQIKSAWQQVILDRLDAAIYKMANVICKLRKNLLSF